MRTLKYAAIVAGFEALGLGWVAACSVGTNGTSTPPGDASTDGSAGDGTNGDALVSQDVLAEGLHEDADEASHVDAPVDAADGGSSDGATCTPSNCPGACCGNQCIFNATCAGCAAGALFCPYSTTVVGSNGQCVSSCSTCAPEAIGLSVECFSCSSGKPAGTCAATASDCPASVVAGACVCSSGDAGSCPGSSQVCLPGADAASPACLSCGQSLTQGQTCSDGLACDQANAACGL